MEAIAVYVRKMIGKKSRRISGLGRPSESFAMVWDVVAAVPKGKVSTYGDIARLCGLPGQARLVGYALHHLPDNMKIPWYRIINSEGKISFRPSSRYNRVQKNLLLKEGVKFNGDRISLEKYRWLRDDIMKERKQK